MLPALAAAAASAIASTAASATVSFGIAFVTSAGCLVRYITRHHMANNYSLCKLTYLGALMAPGST